MADQYIASPEVFNKLNPSYIDYDDDESDDSDSEEM